MTTTETREVTVPLPLRPWGATAEPEVRLATHIVAVPALLSVINPGIVLDADTMARLRSAVATHDVRRGGVFLGTPTSVQWWDRPWTSPVNPGDSALLGAVDLANDRPMRGQTTANRALVTAAGRHAALDPLRVATVVLDLVQVVVDPALVGAPTQPPADPFRRRLPGLERAC